MEESDNTYNPEQIWTIKGKTFKNPVIAERLDKLTYGLLYPAFFGNMIYDLLIAFQKDSHGGFNIEPGAFAIAVIIVAFNIVDFLHLYTDVDASIGGNIRYKTRAYIFCDMATAILLFLAFVFVKYKWPILGTSLLCLIPVIIGRYKRTYFWNEQDLISIKRFERLSVLVFLITNSFWFVKFDHKNWLFAAEGCFLLILYINYAFSTYKKCRIERVGQKRSEK